MMKPSSKSPQQAPMIQMESPFETLRSTRQILHLFVFAHIGYESRKFYTDVLGMNIAAVDDDGKMIAYGTRLTWRSPPSTLFISFSSLNLDDNHNYHFIWETACIILLLQLKPVWSWYTQLLELLERPPDLKKTAPYLGCQLKCLDSLL